MKHPYITPQITIRSSSMPLNDEMVEKFCNTLFTHDPMNYLGDEATRKIHEAMQKQTDQLNRQLEIICHNYLDPPIKGEITKGKLRWRGVKGIVQKRTITPNGFALDFLGILQRGTLITIAGEKIPYKYIDQDKNTCNPFLSTSTS